MPECVNGHHVTERYMAVMWPDSTETAPTCPECDETVPTYNGDAREARSAGGQAQ